MCLLFVAGSDLLHYFAEKFNSFSRGASGYALSLGRRRTGEMYFAKELDSVRLYRQKDQSPVLPHLV